MGYFDDPVHAREYIRMCRGYDGRELIAVLKRYLPPGTRILELGMGPGKDLDLLAKCFRVTGSDTARPFLDIYRESHPHADLLELDAAVLDTDRRFDAVYSNKVLSHLTREELTRSFSRQAALLSGRGLLFHTFWYGDRVEEIEGLRFVYYTEETIRAVWGPEWELLELTRYAEMERDDSFYLILRKK